jgi:hypothetical protein
MKLEPITPNRTAAAALPALLTDVEVAIDDL